jgi:hypothetical protein
MLRHSSSTGLWNTMPSAVCAPVTSLPVEPHAAAGVAQQARDDAQQRALAAAGRADDRDELALRHRQVDAVERMRGRPAAAERPG